MKQEDKELLLKDLCARLPYGVYVLVHDTFVYSTTPYENVYLKSSDISSLIDSISLNERYNNKDKQFNRIIKEHKDFLEFEPYLRPMSSMTEEEREELSKVVSFSLDNFEEEDDEPSEWSLYDKTGIKNLMGGARFYFDEMAEVYNWLLAHHFDYRGLIEKGLALEAPEGMYQ